VITAGSAMIILILVMLGHFYYIWMLSATRVPSFVLSLVKPASTDTIGQPLSMGQVRSSYHWFFLMPDLDYIIHIIIIIQQFA
jgi:hypothetical protein